MKTPSLLFLLLSPPKLAKVCFCFTILSKIKKNALISTKFQLLERSNHWFLAAAPVQASKVERPRQSVRTHLLDTHLASIRCVSPSYEAHEDPDGDQKNIEVTEISRQHWFSSNELRFKRTCSQDRLDPPPHRRGFGLVLGVLGRLGWLTPAVAGYRQKLAGLSMFLYLLSIFFTPPPRITTL